MRVLLLNQYYWPDVAATAQLLTDVGTSLARAGHEVHVVCSRAGYGCGNERYTAEERHEGVWIHRVAAVAANSRSLPHRTANFAAFYVLALQRALRLPGCDVCLALTTPPFVAQIGVVLRRLAGTRLVLWTMDLYPEIAAALGVMRTAGAPYALFDRLAAGLYRHCDAVISLGEKMTARLVERGVAASKITTVHNWAPGDSVRPLPAERSSFRRQQNLDGETVVMYSGHLGRAHDAHTIMHAAEQLEGRADIRFLFIGGGCEFERTRQEMTGRRLRAQHAPHQPLEKLSDTLAAADLHLVATRPEAVGLVVPSKLYGVLAAGRPPVIVGPPDSEGARIVTQARCGLVVPNGEDGQLADAIRRLAGNANLRATMGRRARAVYEREFSMDQACNRIRTVLESSAAEASGRFPRSMPTRGPQLLEPADPHDEAEWQPPTVISGRTTTE